MDFFQREYQRIVLGLTLLLTAYNQLTNVVSSNNSHSSIQQAHTEYPNIVFSHNCLELEGRKRQRGLLLVCHFCFCFCFSREDYLSRYLIAHFPHISLARIGPHTSSRLIPGKGAWGL